MNEKEYQRQYRIRKPWRNSYNNAMKRCSKNGKYFHKGIIFNMKMKDFEFLWNRDKAYQLNKPSIDRINPKGHYEISNCRFIEHTLNSSLHAVVNKKIRPTH